MVPVNRMILVYIMKDSLSVNLRCGDHLNFYTRISTPEREVIPENLIMRLIFSDSKLAEQ